MWEKIWQNLKIQEIDSAPDVARKQKFLKWGLGIGGIVLIFLLQSGLQKVSEPAIKEDKPKKVVLGDLVDAQDVWAARLEGEASKLKDIARDLKLQNDLQEKRLKILEETLIAKIQEFSEKKEEVRLNASEEGGQVSSPSAFLDDFSKPSLRLSESSENSLSLSPVLKPKKILHLNVGSGSSHHADSYVVAGSYARVVLTSGVVVSTSTGTVGNPQPIMMRLAEGGNMPRGWKSHLKDAVIIGSCYGDLSSERAVCRLHKLSLIERGGRTIERPVEGWIIGEDGAPGLRGKVVDKAGAVAREAFLSGILSGMSNFLKFEAQTSVYPISPFGQTHALDAKDALKGGMGQGASNALEKLADFSIKRAESMQPVIVINPGRVVDVVFKEGFDLKSLGDESASQKIQTVSQKTGDIHD